MAKSENILDHKKLPRIILHEANDGLCNWCSTEERVARDPCEEIWMHTTGRSGVALVLCERHKQEFAREVMREVLR